MGCWELPLVRFFCCFNEGTYRGVYIGNTLVAYHFFSMESVLAFSNKNSPYSLFKNFCQALKLYVRVEVLVCIAQTRFQTLPLQQAFRWIDRSLKSKIHHVTHKQKIIMKYLEELLTFVALMAWFTYGYLVLIAVV